MKHTCLKCGCTFQNGWVRLGGDLCEPCYREKFGAKAQPSCDLCLCGDAGLLDLHARCHPRAPLRAETENGMLSLYCYVPECNRLVARARFAAEAINAELLAACEAAKAHVAELRDAWEHGVIHEIDWQGGTRSNRNVDVEVMLRKAIALVIKEPSA